MYPRRLYCRCSPRYLLIIIWDIIYITNSEIVRKWVFESLWWVFVIYITYCLLFTFKDHYLLHVQEIYSIKWHASAHVFILHINQSIIYIWLELLYCRFYSFTSMEWTWLIYLYGWLNEVLSLINNLSIVFLIIDKG